MHDVGGHLSPSERVAQAIASDIDQGTLRPGDPIPSEMTISQRYGVARATARVAVARLRAAGRVATYAGRGSYVLAHTDRVLLPSGAIVTVNATGTASVTVDGVTVTHPPGTVFEVR